MGTAEDRIHNECARMEAYEEGRIDGRESIFYEIDELKTKLKSCAAGPWKDGPPPKNGEDYLAQIKKHKKTFVVVWRNGFGWGCNEPWCLPEDPINHAEIKLPEED